MEDADWLYRAISVPWLSEDPVNLVVFGGVGFQSVFDEATEFQPARRSSLRLAGWEFVGFWRTEFPGWNAIGFLVFRRRAGL